MAQGTGVPYPKNDTVLAQSTSINADAVSSAAAWTRIAAAGEQVVKAGLDTLERDVHLQQAGKLAEFENDQRFEALKDYDEAMRAPRGPDPDGFLVKSQATIEGAVAEVPPWMASHARSYLTRTRNGHYANLLSAKRTRDDRIAGDALIARRQNADDDLMALASAGKVGTEEWKAAEAAHGLVLETAVSTGSISQEKADYLRDNLVGRARGEVAARKGVSDYLLFGFDRAVENLKKDILENDKLSLKPAQRQAIFNRGMSAIRLQAAQDKEDRGAVIDISRDLRARITSNQPYDEGEVRDLLRDLQRTGAAREHRELSVAHATAEATAPYRSGLNLREFAGAVSGQRVSTRLRDAVKTFEGFTTTAKFDYKQYSSGYGTKAAPGEVIDKATAEQRLDQELGKAAAFVDGVNPNLPPGVRDALISLTFNAGGDWAKAELGERIKAGDFAGAKARFLQYNKAGGDVLPGLADRRRKEAEWFDGSAGEPAALAGVPYAGEITKRVQGVFVQQAKAAWPEFKTKIDQGKTLDTEDFQAIRYAAALSGDSQWIDQVEQLAAANGIGKLASTQPVGQQQSIVDEARSYLGSVVSDSLQKQFDRQRKMVAEDPVGFALERGHVPPEAMNLSSPQAAVAAVRQRVAIARGIALEQETSAGNPFRPGETAAIAGAIAGGDGAKTASAFEALAALPDDFVRPALSVGEIKTAMTGAARSTDPARFGAAMQFLDRMYTRAPEEMAHLLGSDVIKNLQDWQAKLRYYSQADLAEQLKQRDDPQVMARHKANIQEGERLAREKKPENLITEWAGWLPFSGPGAPADPRTRDAWMADYTTIFSERYAVSLDKQLAHKQTVERMKPYWNVSEVNGGRLTLYAPESVYRPVNGTYDWMRTQLETDIAAKTGSKPADYMVIADAMTERDVTARRPASYLVSVKNANGEWDVLRNAQSRPHRFAWDGAQVREDAREEFARQRARVFSAPPAPTLGEFGVP